MKFFNRTNDLLEAAIQEDIKTLETLMKKGEDIHHGDDRCLRWSVYYGKMKSVKYLIEHGSDVFKVDEETLQHSSKRGHHEVFNFIKRQQLKKKIESHE